MLFKCIGDVFGTRCVMKWDGAGIPVVTNVVGLTINMLVPFGLPFALPQYVRRNHYSCEMEWVAVSSRVSSVTYTR